MTIERTRRYRVHISYPDGDVGVIVIKHMVTAYSAEDAAAQAQIKWCTRTDHTIVDVEPYDAEADGQSQ